MSFRWILDWGLTFLRPRFGLSKSPGPVGLGSGLVAPSWDEHTSTMAQVDCYFRRAEREKSVIRDTGECDWSGGRPRPRKGWQRRFVRRCSALLKTSHFDCVWVTDRFDLFGHSHQSQRQRARAPASHVHGWRSMTQALLKGKYAIDGGFRTFRRTIGRCSSRFARAVSIPCRNQSGVLCCGTVCMIRERKRRFMRP